MRQKLHQMQKELKVPKTQFNGFGKYNYRSCEDILEHVKKVLPEGVTLSLTDEIVLIGDRYYVKATAIIADEKEELQVCAYAREADDKKGMDSSQVTGAASSYARKYALNGLFAIDDTKDADTDEHTKQLKQKQEADKKAVAEEKRKNAEEWVNGYLLKLEDAQMTEGSHDLINLQNDNALMLKRIAEGYPALQKIITEATNKKRAA